MSRATRIARLLVARERALPPENALKLIHEHAPNKDLQALFWNPEQQKLFVSNGDWAEYDTRKLFDELVKLMGEEHVDMESEVGRPNEDPGWMKIDLETHELKEI